MELLIIRHGRPERVEVTEGTADPDLTDLGHRQAAAVGAALADAEVDHIVSSPMARAFQTAQPLAATLGYEIEVIEHLRESDHESKEYMPAEQLKAEDPAAFAAWADDLDSIFGSAGREAFTADVVGAFEQVIAANAGRRVAVFCHGMVTGVWIAHCLNHDDPFVFAPDYTGVSRMKISTRHGIMSLRSFNETQHLAGLPDVRL